MSAGGPLRRRRGDAERTGFRVVRSDAVETVLSRRRTTSGAGLLLLVPAAIAFAVLSGACGLRVTLPGLIPLLVIIVPLWPLPYERLHIDRERVTWKDRVLGDRFRAPLGDTRVVTRTAGAEKAIVLASRRGEQLLAMGAPEDVDALVSVLHDALTRARGE